MASSEHDYYALLGVTYEATAQEIKKAYRKNALKYHPDKVGADNEQAAEMFHLLTLASDTLADPTKKSAYDTLHKSRIAQKRKLEQMDSHLRKARQDLNDREQAAKRAKDTAFMAAVQRKNEIDRLREEGQRKVHAAEEQRRQMFTAKVDAAKHEANLRKVREGASVMDCTLKVKWKKKYADFTKEDLEMVFGKYGKVESVIMSSKGKGTAMVIFDSLLDARSVMKDQASPNFRNLQVVWAAGEEPSILKSLDLDPPSEKGTTQTGTTSEETKSAGSEFGFGFTGFAAGDADDDYETITLLKMQQAAKTAST
ncbi:uncharacterized protein SPPG_04161 [Spizellomyces punctatus DAOM BR117]|uniref:J domain-containing protein n=1 Tax=Spizellomyces punctatus (strain DAOM BR117) TaxID=645134 RepID=A0A0L0HJM6_SPIPD|nr:uncharacterized protein SPPG_04161 [Spizellomyces punctatus DAOM BR117]KND01070.1 hypothetical protein SPPG_04161 [Spizellomyces punctatus DAOM BR117]|eukprot:XP_016609109.1 hypothetical protein SPPG_04161 [Spizellomyces punctatus DAOM BR117]